ncbi:FIG000605: protein co-occurring with transport systems (COG1739) [Olavius sp. associated proteobacterium Delta 1]|nr:FIG000605: protein co-occurring with transport systems (COG1739) [Olavius sp. associated proteobacterium Delta 1]
MSQDNAFQVPAGNISIEQEIKRSRFITSIGRAPDKQQAIAFIGRIRSTYPDANHHCWAYVAGNPFDTVQIGMSDDGEPQGTAGKPMLSILQHRKIGEIVVVVTRYFGGIKLGTGGLVRAYSSSVQMALQTLPLAEFVALAAAQITLPYPYEDRIRRLLEKMQVTIKDVTYQDCAVLLVEFPVTMGIELERQLGDQTKGEAQYILIGN